MPRGGPARNPRLTVTNASTPGIWVHVQLETHGACVLPVLRPSTGGTQALRIKRWQLPPRSVGEWFRLWRTPLGVGNADAGVCVVLSCKGRKPEPAGYYRRHEAKEGDVDWSDSPHQAADRAGRLRSMRRPGLCSRAAGELRRAAFLCAPWPRARCCASQGRRRYTGREQPPV